MVLGLTPSARGDDLPRASDNVHHSGPASAGGIAGSSFLDVGVTVLAPVIASAPFGIPALLADTAPPYGWSLMAHPYAEGAPGYLEPVAVLDDEVGVPFRRRRHVGVQIAIEAVPPPSNVTRLQARARVVTVYRVEFDAAYGLYQEANTGGGASSVGLGNMHGAARFVQSEHLLFRAGLGVRHWIDKEGSSFGVDGLYAADIFWGRPMTTSVELTGGTLGAGWVFEPRLTVGAVLGIAELYVGYDAIWIFANDKRSTAYLGGPVVGTRLYF
jgi:hypothetical protein